MKTIKTLAIANRGEVAVRIIHACEELGIRSVLLHSEADINSKAFRMADQCCCIGGADASESYLHIENNIKGALSKGADAIHPGFGFLSENADFARACEKNGLTFIGPSPETIEKLGDKISSKEIADSASVPVAPDYRGENQDPKYLVEECSKIGFPVIAKAAAGGGGRGMKVINNKEEALEQIHSAQREALAAFGSSTLFLEKYLNHAKHIEVQIFGDASGKVIHLFDRECSVQRRHQKIIEESTSPSLTASLRKQILQYAVRIAEKVQYRNAGTVEFLLQDDEVYFLEVNTRLQVEHPVTEMVLGVDLVKAQILTAQGEVGIIQDNPISPRGHAIECRIYAEDPYMGGIPSTGKLGTISWPQAPGRRFDTGVDSGDEVTSFYDSMIAKVITWDENRSRAIQKMLKTLDETILFGVKTNIPYLKRILSHPEFTSGTMTTQFIQSNFPDGLTPEALNETELSFTKQAMNHLSVTGQHGSKESNPWQSDWRLK